MPSIVPRRNVQVDGRNFIAGTLYSVAEDVVERIVAAETDASEALAEYADEEATETALESTEAASDGVAEAEATEDEAEAVAVTE